jgi:hypothetical protein
MRVKARAVILIDGRLIVAAETGLEGTPGQLVYVSEIVESVRRGLASEWRETPRWLGNLSRTPRPALGTDSG